VLLLDQDRRRWDQLLLRRGLQALARAEKLGGRGGYYVLQASIAACHGHAIHAGETDWKRIAALYAELAEMTQSPIVELNRAVAVSMCKGPEAGLAIVDALLDEPCLKDFHLLAAARGDLLERVGRAEEAREAFKRAALLTRNLHERKIMTARAARLS
jgi:predicted RNA polymerase sigma factor